MIKIAGTPAEPQNFENDYPHNSIEWLIIQTMSESTENYEYNSEDELKFELELRKATVNAAIALDHSGMEFAIFRKSKCNSDYWNRTAEGGFELKNGVSASAAIRDIFQSGPKYATECATAILIVYYRAVLAVFPDALFDKVFSDIQLMNWHHIDPLLKSVGLMATTSGFLPGDRRYFKNPDVNPETPEWQGENVIMLGSDTFYGHGIGIHNEATMIKALNQNRIEDAQKSAYLIKRAGRPDFEKLMKIRNTYHA
jgi:protein-glutamine gamma-glutamyltransferase